MILYIVTDTPQTSYKVNSIDIVLYLHNFIQHSFYIYHNFIILYRCKLDPIHMTHSNTILAHVFSLLNDLAQWFLMQRV